MVSIFCSQSTPESPVWLRRSRNDQGESAKEGLCAALPRSSCYNYSELFPSLCRIMGRQVSSEEIFMRAKADGYLYKAHHEEDSQSNKSTDVPKTIKDQTSVLRRYEMYDHAFDCSRSSE